MRKCGALSLELEPAEGGPDAAGASPGRREIRAAMQFGDTEIKVTAVDVSTNRSVRAAIDLCISIISCIGRQILYHCMYEHVQ